MTRFAYLLVYFALAVSLVLAFFNGLPASPWANTVNDLITFLGSETVAQGLSWLAWFFPIANFASWIPGFLNALIIFFTLRGTLFVLSLHA